MQIINRHFLSGIIHLVRAENFPKNLHFWNPDTHTYICVSGGSNVSFSRSVAYLLNEWYLTRLFLEQNFTLRERKNSVFRHFVRSVTLQQLWTFWY